MLKLAELNYHYHKEYTNLEQVIVKHKLSSGFIHFIKQKVNLLLIKHFNSDGEIIRDNIRYRFFRSRNKFWYIPFHTHRFLRQEKPDIVLVQGFVFVLQVMHLRLKLGKKCVILVQHHGEKPFKGVKGFLQRMADASINGYLFTSLDNASVWLDKKVISNKNKCFEILSASADFIMKDQQLCKIYLGMVGKFNFLWVGRLNKNKDPITILNAFEKYIAVNTEARLYMIYQTEELLEEVKLLVKSSVNLINAVQLVGKIEHEQLEDWFNAADYFISGSHSEGSGYALAEAMCSGCIPVVTAIPSFTKIMGDGRYGILFEAGNPGDLFIKLLETEKIDNEKYSALVYTYAKENLSYKTVADQVYELASSLVTK